jgi:squalene-associated FAD-dependent desaturase
VTRVAVVGGGLAGMASAAALGSAGYQVDLYESRPFLGGRAASYPIPGEAENLHIDNCQHILLRCCVNLLNFYARLGVSDAVKFEREFFFLEPGGRTSILKSGIFPAPLHFTEAFAKLTFLSLLDKIAVGRALLAIRSERTSRQDLDRITMLDWLKEKGQTPRAIERFWRQVLVSAVNEELDRMAAAHGFQVFWLGFLAGSNLYEMGVPARTLGDLYRSDAWSRWPNVHLHERCTVEEILREGNAIQGLQTSAGLIEADTYITALPFERTQALLPELPAEWSAFTHSPITGIHLWFDKPVTDLPHGTLLDTTIQWFFNKGEGRYLMLVVSASRSLTAMSRQDVIDLSIKELAQFLPAVSTAKLVKAHVVKEVRATFSASPGLEAHRPGNDTRWRNLFLAGDWTRTGWPATMEGAVRSGYLAAEALTRAAGQPQRFLIPDVA